MSKIIVGIPYWESDPGKREILHECIHSLKGYDQLLLLAGKQPTLTIAWNMLADMAFDLMEADYCVFANDDIILKKGLISDLCIPDRVLSPTVGTNIFKTFHAHLFSLPRSIWKKIGRFDEQFKTYWQDTDYCKRMIDAGVRVETNFNVDIEHKEPARTLKALAGITQTDDEQAFIKKWGKKWFDPSMGK